MSKKTLSVVAVAAFLAVELLGLGMANAQGRRSQRLGSRIGRNQNQCCQADACQTGTVEANSCGTDTCQTGSCLSGSPATCGESIATEQFSVAPASYAEPVSSFAESSCSSGCGASDSTFVQAESSCGESTCPCGQPVSSCPVASSSCGGESISSCGGSACGGAVASIASVTLPPSAPSSDCGCAGESTSFGTIEPMPIQVVSGAVSLEATPATGCGTCGTIQQATYAEPVMEGQIYSGDTGCVGCEPTTAIQGCASGDCGSVVETGTVEGEIVGSPVEGVISEGVISEGVISEGAIIHETAPAAVESSTGDVPEPPTVAPEPSSDDQDA